MNQDSFTSRWRLAAGIILVAGGLSSACGPESGASRGENGSAGSSTRASEAGTQGNGSDSARGASFSERLQPGSPVLEVGVADSLPGHALHNVVGALWLGHSLIIANSGSSEIRVFDRSGQLQRSLGRTGSGPGEFLALMRIWESGGDTLFTYDVRLSRITAFAIDSGDVLWSEQLPVQMGQAVDRFENGSFLMTQAVEELVFPLGTKTVDSAAVHRFEMGRDRQELVRLPARTRFRVTVPDGAQIATGLPLEPLGFFLVIGDTLLTGYGDTAVITKRSSISGEEIGALRIPMQRRPFNEQLRAIWMDEMVARLPGSRQEAEGFVSQLPRPDSLPVFDRLKVDGSGRLWVREFPLPGADSARWVVIDGAGALVAEISFTVDTELLQVGTDFAVVLNAGADGTQRVAVLPLDGS